MQKEVLIAVLIGLSMGLVITYGIYRVQSSINQPPVTDVADVLESENASESAEAVTMLSVHSPERGTIQTENTTTIAGTTLANAHVVLFVNEEDYITESDSSGNFTFNSVNLEDGTNVLTTHVVDNMGESTKEERVVIVSDIYEQNQEPATESAEAEAGEAETEETEN